MKRKAGTALNLMVACVFCLSFIFFTEPLIRLFSSDDEVIKLAVVLLYFGAAFQLADCLQVAAICGLRAYRDTRTPPKYQFIAFLLFGMPIGVGLSFYQWVPGLEGGKGMWFAMVLSLTIVGILLFFKLLRLGRSVDDPQTGNAVLTAMGGDK